MALSDAPVSHALRPLGKSDLMASPLAWGMWRFKGDDVKAATIRVEAARESGITLFDTADVYGLDNAEAFGAAEALLGAVFRADPAIRRSVLLATKGGIELGAPYNSSATYLVSACEASLRRLGVDQIDLYQIHRPDLLAHPLEIAEAFACLHASGKARAFGVSNHAPAQVATLQGYLTTPLASIQPEFSPLAIAPLSDGVLDQALAGGLGVLAWSPLAGGRLLDRSDARACAVCAALKPVADRAGASVSAAAYAWIMAHPTRPIPIVGSQDPARIRAARDALSIGFTRAEWYAVLSASRGAPLP